MTWHYVQGVPKLRKIMKYRFISNAVLSAVLLMGGAMSSPVLAENTNAGSTQINYTVDESYAWTAPANITFTADSNGSEVKAGTVNVTKNTIGSGKTLKISIASDQVFELADANNPSNKRSYTVKDGTNDLSAGSEVLAVEAGTDTGSKNLNVQLYSVATEVAGSYAGTLKFVSTIESTETGAGSEGGSSTPVIDGTNITLSSDVDGNGVVSKGDTLTFATSYMYSGSNTGPTEFLVLNTNGSDVELLATTNYQTSKFNTSSVTTTDSAGQSVLKYEDSTLDTLLNTTYFNSLSSTMQSKIKTKSITQNTWQYNGNPADATVTGFSSTYKYKKTGTVGTYDRKVYALDVEDVKIYLGDTFTGADLNNMFFGTNASVSKYAWLRSAKFGNTTNAFNVNGSRGNLNYSGCNYDFEARPAFTISLN